MKTINVGICGLGTVGSGVFNVLKRNRQEITARTGCDIRVTHIGARRDRDDCDTSGVKVERDIFDVAKADDVQVIVELIGGIETAKALVLAAIENGKHVITANKALIAEYGNEIFAAAEKQGVAVYYEAAVAGGIPIIKAMREGLSANKIQWVAGIINGTGNFILTEMRDKNRPFADVLKEAQELGYAEADPTFDVEGIDACHKLVILSALAFGVPLQFEKAFTEGISTIQGEDVELASQLGFVIKHLGITRKTAEGVELRVHPTLIPKTSLLSNVDGVMNAVMVHADAVGSTMYYGAGAGSEPTASSVIADICDLARVIDAGNEARVPALSFNSGILPESEILSIADVHTAYYVRFSALDEPGVMRSISDALAIHGVSIESMLQNAPEKQSNQVTIALVTNVMPEAVLQSAVESLQALDVVSGEVTFIRTESLAE